MLQQEAKAQSQTAAGPALYNDANLFIRQLVAALGQVTFFAALIAGLVALVVLFLNVVSNIGGYVVYRYQIDPLTITPRTPLEELDEATLRQLAQDNIPSEVIALLPEYYGQTLDEMDQETLVTVLYNEVAEPDKLTARPLESLTDAELVNLIEQSLTTARFAQLNAERPFTDYSRAELLEFIEVEILGEAVAESWTLFESLFNREAILQEIARDYPGQNWEFRWWLTPEFILSALSSRAETSGLRPALIGSVLILLTTLLFAVPIGVSAGVYLEEFAPNNRLTNLIQANIYNLSGVPSIVYGMLGLAVFVNALSSITTGAAFGNPNPPPNGRTILSAGLTMALLILPLIIINTQEAIRAVPQSLRDAALALGATKLQTVWYHVMPVALPGILTGVILATARAVGETAPLIVVGAAAFLTSDPSGPFSTFTVLPIQIFKWTADPIPTFRYIAAAAIVVLLTVVLLFNMTAIILRNRLRKQL